jgi:hypothetical protein
MERKSSDTLAGVLTRKTTYALGAILLSLAVFAFAQAQKKYRTSEVGYRDTPVIPGQKWKVHDIDRPVPRVVTPGAKPGDAPADAVVLFNGKDMSQWTEKGQPVTWKVENGYFEVRCEKGAGSVQTKEKFGDAQYHIEWASPAEITGDSQWRGNSGLLLMNRYEVQVLDSFNNRTYPDGQAGAIYGWWPPLVNATRKPGEWQAYDIFFEAPKFENGKVTKPAYVTVMLNGVLLHHHQEIGGPMAHKVVRPYEAHGAEEPFGLQNHDTPVRYRNIWVRRITGYDKP